MFAIPGASRLQKLRFDLFAQRERREDAVVQGAGHVEVADNGESRERRSVSEPSSR